MARASYLARWCLAVVMVMLFVDVQAEQRSPAEAQPLCTWTIGIMGALEGEYASIGTPAANGIRLAVDEANESGDLSCWLETRAENTGGDPNQAPRKAQRLVADERLVACVCGFFSGETLASGQIFAEAGVAMLSTGEITVLRDQRFRTWFRLVAPADAQGRSTGVYIKRAFDPKKVVIVHDNQDYSLQMAKDVAAEVGKRFDDPFFVIDPEDKDHSAVVTQVKKKKPDVVFYGGYAPQAWSLQQQLRDAGVKARFVTDGGAKVASIARNANATRGWLSCGCNDPTEDDAADFFVAEYRNAYGIDPRHYAADTFDGTNIVIDALRELSGGETNEEARAHVVAYLDALDFDQGTMKTYSWDKKGELEATNQHVWIWEWTRRKGFEMLGTVAELSR